MPFDDVEKKKLNWWQWKYQKIIHTGLERFERLSWSELGRREVDTWTGRSAKRQSEAQITEHPKQPKLRSSSCLSWKQQELGYVMIFCTGLSVSALKPSRAGLVWGQNCPTSLRYTLLSGGLFSLFPCSQSPTRHKNLKPQILQLWGKISPNLKLHWEQIGIPVLLGNKKKHIRGSVSIHSKEFLNPETQRKSVKNKNWSN